MRVFSDNSFLGKAELEHGAMEVHRAFTAAGFPAVICCSSDRKLDYILSYEASRYQGVPFCPLPSHLSATQALSFFRGLPFSCGLYNNGSILKTDFSAPSALQPWLDRSELIFLTSGTNGRRKLVFSSSDNVKAAVDAILERIRYCDTDTVINFLPMSFDYGFYQYLLCKSSNSVLALGSTGPYIATLSEIDAVSATVLPIVPSFLAAVQPLLGRRVSARSVKKITSTGEVFSGGLQGSLRAALPEALVYPMYGLTECKRVSILTPDDNPKRPGSVGRAIS